MSSSAAASRPDYRADIDGLRALSVLCVILFHAEASGFAGGYIGVDVFFVISGYLITRLLVAPSEHTLGHQLAHFYLRRARRILPALLVTLLISLAVAVVLLLPADLPPFGRDMALAAAMLGNVGAWLGGGYFDLGNRFSPLRHLWSIAVEEQFYLVYPVVLLLLTRYAKHLRTAAIAVAGLGSLAACIWLSYRHTALNYYFSPTRGWQLLLGALPAVWIVNRINNRVANELLALLAMIVLGVAVSSDEATGYPGWRAVTACVATTLLIVTGSAGSTVVGRALSVRPLVFTGLISYSLYLWHFPLLTFARYYTIVELSAGAVLVMITATYVLAALSWWLIERPVRQRSVLKSNGVFVAVVAGCSVLLMATGTALWNSEGWPQRMSSDVQTLTRKDAGFDADAVRCLTLSLKQIEAGELCRYGSLRDGARRVVVWGDSHAMALIPVYREIADRRGLQIYVAMSGACRPLLSVESAHQNEFRRDYCARFNAAAVQAIRHLNPQQVVLNAYWNYPDIELVPRDELLATPDSGLFTHGVEETLRLIDAPGRSVCAVVDVPVYDYPVPYALGMAQRRGIDPDFMTIDRATATAQSDQVHREFRALAERGLLETVDPKEALCASGECLLKSPSGVSLYRDHNHLSVAGAQIVSSVIDRCFE